MPKKRKKVSSSSSYYELLIPTFLVILVTIGVFIFANQANKKEIMTTKSISINTKQSNSSDMQLFIAVKINGIGQGRNVIPPHRTKKVTIYLYGTTTSKNITKTAYLTYDGKKYFTGVVHLGKMAEGAYFIKLVSNYTLQTISKPEIMTLTNNQLNILPPITLYQGDMNNDTILNKNDYTAILQCFQNNLYYCTRASVDFNDDGVINILDYNVLLQSFTAMHAMY